MASVWYIGSSGSRTITAEDWSLAGVTGPTTTWNSSNGYSVLHSALTVAQILVLRGDAGFWVDAPDTARKWSQVPGNLAVGNGSSGSTSDSAIALMVDLLTQGQTAAGQAAAGASAAQGSATASAASAAASEAARAASVTAKTASESAKTASETARDTANTSRDSAGGSATAAGTSATNAANSATASANSATASDTARAAAVTAKTAAETARAGAEAARDAANAMIIPDDAVTTGKVASKAITAEKMADDTITGVQIAPNAVGANELADNSVDSAAIIDGTIVDGDISPTAAIALSKLAVGYMQGQRNGTATTTKVDVLTEAQYQALVTASTVDANTIYLTT